MVKKFRPPIKANVGKQRLTGNERASQAEFTRMTRESFEEVLKNFTAWTEHMVAVAPEILLEALQPTFDESQELVPKDTRALMHSGYLEVRSFRGKVQAEIGYGKGGFPHYAVYVHEDLEMNHRPPEQAKFLQQPLEENEGQIRESVLRGFKEGSGA